MTQDEDIETVRLHVATRYVFTKGHRDNEAPLAALSRIRSTIESLQRTCAEWQDKCEAMTDDLHARQAKWDAEIERLREKARSNAERRRQAEAERDTLQQRLAAIEQIKRNLMAEVARFREDIDRREAENIEAQREVVRLQQRVRELEATAQVLERFDADRVEELPSLRAQVERLRGIEEAARQVEQADSRKAEDYTYLIHPPKSVTETIEDLRVALKETEKEPA